MAVNDKTGSGWISRVALVAIILGIGVRFGAYMDRDSLWLDEASLALNILTHGFGELARPLEWGQAAPIGFLWLTKAMAMVLGTAEWVFRLWPFVAGVLVVPLTWGVGRRLVGETAAMVSTVLVAASLLAIRYSTEAKPYASDAFVALLLAWLALRVAENLADGRRWTALIVAGAFAMTLSLPAALVLGASLGFLSMIRRTDGSRATRPLVTAAGVWGIGGVALLVLVLLPTRSTYLTEYWAPVMLDPLANDFAARVIRTFMSVAATPLRWDGNLRSAFVGMGIAATGLIVLSRGNRRALWLVVGPTLLGAGASVLGAYPMSDRLAFFASPLMLLATGAAVAGVANFVGRTRAAAGPVVLAAVTVGLATWVGMDAWRFVQAPNMLEPTRSLFQAIREEARRDSLPVYVFARAAPAWLYATTDWTNADTARVNFYRRNAGRTEGEANENFARNGDASPLIAAELRVPGSRPAELLGMATGVRYRIAGATSRTEPSPQWSRIEAKRIREVARPFAWVVASHFFDGSPRDELRVLQEEIVGQGMSIVERRSGAPNVSAFKVTTVGAPDYSTLIQPSPRD